MRPAVRLGVVITHASAARPTHTTVRICAEAVGAGHDVRVAETAAIDLDERGRVQLRVRCLDGVVPTPEAVADALRGGILERRVCPASSFDVLLLRNNPFDAGLLAMASAAASGGTLVLNPPHALPRITHKSWLAALPPIVPRPRTLVTRSWATSQVFASMAPAGVVLKPARASGGRGVGLVGRGAPGSRLEQAFRAAAQAGDGFVVLQDYLPAAELGEKRLLWLDGQLLGGYRRERPDDDFRHNIALGATAQPCAIDAEDRVAVDAVGVHLSAEGVWFAGVDVIGGQLIEVNVLNPGGAHFTELLGGVPVARRLVESLEHRLSTVSPFGRPSRLSVV